MHSAINFIRFIWNKGFFHLLSSNIFIQTVAFASQLFVAWILSADDIGRIRIMQTFLGLAAIIGGLGFNTSVLKLCSEKRPDEEKKILYRSAFKYTMISSGMTYGIIVLLSFLEVFSSDPQINFFFPWFALTLLPYTLTQLMSVYLQAQKKIQLMALIQAITRIVTIVLIILLTLWWNLKGFIIASVLGAWITAQWMYKRIESIDKPVIPTEMPNAFSIHWFYAKYAFMANMIGQIGLYLDIYLINYLIDNRESVGHYSFAVTLTVALQLITTTVQQIVSPFFSEKSDYLPDLFTVYRKYNRIFISAAFGLTLISVIAGPYIIHFTFNGKYDQAMDYFQLLCIAWFIRCFYSLKGIAIWAMGKIHLNFYATLIALPVNIILTYSLIHHFQLLGAAYAMIGNAFVTYLIVSFQFFRLKPNHENTTQ